MVGHGALDEAAPREAARRLTTAQDPPPLAQRGRRRASRREDHATAADTRTKNAMFLFEPEIKGRGMPLHRTQKIPFFRRGGASRAPAPPGARLVQADASAEFAWRHALERRVADQQLRARRASR